MASATAIAVSAGATIVVAVAGMALTRLGPWYRGLVKPSWQPPDWAFGPVWTVVFTGTAWAAARMWTRATTDPTAPDVLRWVVVLAFVVNGALNVGWTWCFFWRRRPDWALREVVVLWSSIVVLIALALPFDGAAAALLVPYLVWVAFAAVLNRAIVRLNGPFPGP